MSDSTTPPARDDLVRLVRVGFIKNGTTLSAWCKDQGLAHSYVYKVLKAETNGPAAKTLRDRLVHASNAQAA